MKAWVKSSWQIIIVLVLLLVSSPGYALETWPAVGEWVGFLNADWGPSSDPNDQNSDYLDIVVDQYGFDSYFYATETSLFFRLGLEGTPIDNKGKLKPFAWFAPIDVDEDLAPDWSIMISGISEAIEVAYDPSGSGDPTNVTYSLSDPVATGDVRITSAGYTGQPDFVYVDVQIPFSAFTAAGYANSIDFGTALRMFFLTSTSESLTIKDGTGGAVSVSGALGAALPTGGVSMGFLYDTRDSDPYSSDGTWSFGETISVVGYGWPTSVSTYYNGGSRSALILDAAGDTVWTGTLTTDASGNIASQSTWTLGGSYVGGVARIYVEHPSEPGKYYPYDFFTITDPPTQTANINIAKSASVDSLREGNSFQYTITLTNTGLADGSLASIVDTLPAGLTYIPGSSSSLTSANPTIADNILTWSGNWTVKNINAAFNYVTLVFSVSLDASAGDNLSHPNRAGVTYDGTEHSASGETASVKFLPPAVSGPDIFIQKAVSTDTSITSSNLNYTITITNNGDAAGSITAVSDTLPAGFTYLANSSTGLTTSEPSITGQALTWSGPWAVNAASNPPNYKTLSFTVTASSTAGNYSNVATVSGSNFSTQSTGATAWVTLTDPPSAANMVVTKTAVNDTLQSGTTATYSIHILNNGGSHGHMNTVIDSLPAGFAYISGSTSGLTTSDPSISGRRLTWAGSWTVNKNTSTSLTFSASSAIANDIFYNKAIVQGTDFVSSNSGWTAPIRVLSPELLLTKSVDVVDASPGDTLTYTVTYMNAGDDIATAVIIYEIVPNNTSYIANSAAGTDMTITYSHDNGVSYDSSQLAPVTNIKFEKGAWLNSGGSGSIEFRVRVSDS